MKLSILCTLACGLAVATPSFAGTIDFENVPSTYWNDAGGGQQDLGSFYSGVTFSSGAQIIHNSTEFPAHSGSLELFQSNSKLSALTITFATPQTDVSFWYSTLFGLSITDFNTSNTALSTVNEAANVNIINTIGTDSQVEFSSPDGIKSIVITDTGGLGRYFTLDDLTAPGIGSNGRVPDVTSTFALLALGGVVLVSARRKFAVK